MIRRIARIYNHTAIHYSLPSLILSSMMVSYYVFVPKLYSQTVSIQTLGLAVMLTRLWDALIDPMIGILSDRSQKGRKFWLIFAILPLCISFNSLFLFDYIPVGQDLLWFVFWSIIFFFCWTCYTIPYEALGQDLVSDYDQRTVLFSYRDGSIVFGTLIAALIPSIFKFISPGTSEWNRWLAISIIYSASLIIFTYILNKCISDKKHKKKSKSDFSVLKSIRLALTNPYFKTLLIAYSISSFGLALPATLFLFYVESVLQSDKGPIFLMLYFLIGILALPFWTNFSFRYGKLRSWLLALFVHTAGFFGVYFLSPGEELLFVFFISVSAIGYGASLALPSSIQADIIDSEELRTSFRKEGEFLGVWYFAKKTIAAISAGLALWVLGFQGFNANLNNQNQQTLLALRVLYCLVPCLCNFLAIYTMRNFSLGREEHESMKLEIERKWKN